jgi:acylphosphatase
VTAIRCRAIVHGRVQGVFYRDTCRGVAADLGVTGWVRNRSDGTVEVVAEGPRDAVDRLLAWCRTGPPHARVDRVEISDERPVGEQGFRVRH